MRKPEGTFRVLFARSSTAEALRNEHLAGVGRFAGLRVDLEKLKGVPLLVR